MLKFLHVAQISNFRTFLVDFSYDFKHIVFSCLDELIDVPYMVRKFETSSFQSKLNQNNISLVALDMSQTIHESLV
jgi:hypothetical protein